MAQLDADLDLKKKKKKKVLYSKCLRQLLVCKMQIQHHGQKILNLSKNIQNLMAPSHPKLSKHTHTHSDRQNKNKTFPLNKTSRCDRTHTHTHTHTHTEHVPPSGVCAELQGSLLKKIQEIILILPPCGARQREECFTLGTGEIEIERETEREGERERERERERECVLG